MELIIILGGALCVALFFRKSPRPRPRQSGHKKLPQKIRPNTSYYKNKPTPKQKPRAPVDHDPPPEIPESRQIRGRAWVIDGDTIVVGKIKVRLAGIDAPELDQPWGRKAKWEMVCICKGQTIRVEFTGESSFDRLIGTCYLPDGRDIGAELVKAGLALDGGYFSEGKYRHLEDPEMRKKLKRYGHWR